MKPNFPLVCFYVICTVQHSGEECRVVGEQRDLVEVTLYYTI